MKNSQFLEGTEVWKTVSYLPPNIEVSSKGNVRRYVTLTETEPMKTRLDGGYLIFSLNRKTYRVNRVVADAFLEKPELAEGESLLALHKNGDKTDNRISNLEWVPAINNMRSTRFVSNSIKQYIYCKEMDKAFATLLSASLMTRLPESLISKAAKNNAQICGLTFKYIDKDSAKDKENVCYVHPDDTYNEAIRTPTVEKLYESIDAFFES